MGSLECAVFAEGAEGQRPELKPPDGQKLCAHPGAEVSGVWWVYPRTTKETRQKLIKQVGAECEQQKGKLRNVRKKYMDRIRVIEKSKTVSKDDVDRMKKKVDSITDGVTKEMNEMMKKKEQELAIWLEEPISPPLSMGLILSLVCCIPFQCRMKC